MGLAVVVIEVRNHTQMWADHQSGQNVWTDQELVFEIILFGFVFPLLAGAVLGYSGRTAIERDEIAQKLALRRSLIAQLHDALDWRELADLIVTIPGQIVSAERVWLLTQFTTDEALIPRARWDRSQTAHLPVAFTALPKLCSQCDDARSVPGIRMLTCGGSDPGCGPTRAPRYWLQLATEETGPSALLIEMTHGHPLTPAQMKELDDLGNEIALSINNANLQHQNRSQVDLAHNERQRIARDLHDTLGQNISYLRFKLEQLSSTQLDSEGVELQKDLASMVMVADEAYEQMRDTLEELRTTEEQDLEETIRQHAAQAAARSGFQIAIRSGGPPGKFSARQVRQIMYIVREALNNIEKHAQAENVAIFLQWGDGTFTLVVRDNGRGFEQDAVATEDRYGMVIMQERAAALKADLVVDSARGAGTSVSLTMPLSKGVGQA